MVSLQNILIGVVSFAFIMLVRQVVILSSGEEDRLVMAHLRGPERGSGKVSGVATPQGGSAAGNQGTTSTTGMCATYQKKGLYQQADKDFAQYAKGLSQEQQQGYRNFCEQTAKHACVTIIILDGRIFVKHFFPGYQSRHRGTVHAIYRVSQRFGPLPNAQFVIEVTDGNFGMVDLPIFVIAKTAPSPYGILYPDFTFFGWPEANCPPERSHAYGYLFDLYASRAKKAAYPGQEGKEWAGKKDSIFWRGGQVHNPQRGQALKIFEGLPNADMQFMGWTSVSLTGTNGAPGCVGLLDQCSHRYLAFLNGNTYSSRLKFQLLCGSCVFASTPEWVEWWTSLFKPHEDWVEVKKDWSDAPQKLEQIRSSSDAGRAIAERGRAKAIDLLSEDAIDCYWLRLIEKAAAILPPPEEVDFEKLPPSTRPIEDVLLFGNDVIISDQKIEGPQILVR